MTVTLRQIADQLDLDISTVSRVLNRPEQARASLKTRQKIQNIARDMGYQANITAQSLARGRTGCVGVMLPDIMDASTAHYANMINRLLHDQQRQVVSFITGWSPDKERDALDALSGRQVDAMINLYYQHENLGRYQQLRAQGHTLAFRVMDREISELPVDCVGIDISDAFEQLVRHLVERGYRKIGIVGGFVSRDLAAGRIDHPGVGYVLAAHEALGLTFDPKRAVPCPLQTAEDACVAVTAALREDPERFDAMIVQSSKLLPGVWHALHQRGLRVPDQVGLASVSDTETCRLLDVPVTVWDQPVEKICRGLTSIIRNRLAGKRELTKIQYASRLLERESTRGRAGHERKEADTLS